MFHCYMLRKVKWQGTLEFLNITVKPLCDSLCMLSRQLIANSTCTFECVDTIVILKPSLRPTISNSAVEQ